MSERSTSGALLIFGAMLAFVGASLYGLGGVVKGFKPSAITATTIPAGAGHPSLPVA